MVQEYPVRIFVYYLDHQNFKYYNHSLLTTRPNYYYYLSKYFQRDIGSEDEINNNSKK